ncbi:glycerol-3-phosphate 1-O-acyltransferase PlsY [Virgibacillus pantothenticus]|uniref:glycerol-3-phosphate 1-O-acyltransferase PlsY n=1 Tax=Virgibacillus pantothenticus TaxID=1473 RepID=UPI00098684E1|nr:glycerol-3-phosphate 1-O-acyltransferase PlsY [Virgibacillus pantothenticus]
MTNIILLFSSLASGYLLGSLNSAVIVGKIYGKDIRSCGSRSAGLTNTLRVLGKTAAVFVLVGDILKGIIACFIGLIFFEVYFYTGEAQDSVSLLIAGLGAVIGHNWPLLFKFKGGKGALTSVSVLFVVDWVMALLYIVFFILIVAITRYVSLGTISATGFIAVVSFIPVFGHTFYFNIFACLMATMIIIKHRENIQRLLSGTENKLIF